MGALVRWRASLAGCGVVDLPRSPVGWLVPPSGNVFGLMFFPMIPEPWHERSEAHNRWDVQEPVRDRITRRPTALLVCFSAKTLSLIPKQSDFHQKTASKLASLDLVIYPGQAC